MLKKLNDWLHLWLGLASGIIVLIVSLTGCILVFQEEIESLTQPYRHVTVPKNAQPLPPSQIRAAAERVMPGKTAYSIRYNGRDRSANISFNSDSLVFIDPYTAKLLAIVDHEGFFHEVEEGHTSLWLPPKIGHVVVSYATLVFAILLLTGLVLWWPKKWNRTNIQQAFRVKWSGKFKRINYDLHNVLGFYSLFFVAVIGITGIVWGIDWFSKGVYWATSGGKSLPEWTAIQSDTSQTSRHYSSADAADIVWNRVVRKHADADGFLIDFPDSSDHKATIGLTVYPTAGQFYNNQSYTFDQHTLAELSGNDFYRGSFAEAPAATKLRRLNYDIHVGSILGLPGKFLAFFASLIGASLPITGFIVWWGKNGQKGGKSKPKKRNENLEKPLDMVKPASPIRKSPVQVGRDAVNMDSDSQ